MPQYLKGKGGEEMLRKLMRVVLTIVGAIVGYGVFLLARFLLSVSGYEQRLNLSSTQEVFIAILCVIIFGLIFFRLTPTLGKQGSKVCLLYTSRCV